MSTAVEQTPHLNEQPLAHDLVKPEIKTSSTSQPSAPVQHEKNQHPLHQYDLTKMSEFYNACIGKLKEQHPSFMPAEWCSVTPVQAEQLKPEPLNPFVLSSKQRVYEAFANLARETGEPMVLMPNFDYGDILNFERFLQALKQDGVNSIGKYKLYLNNKDMRKFEVDLVVIHPRFGVLLFEVKECDHLDNKRRSRARVQLNNARSCFESMGRLVAEAKGWTHSEASIQVSEFIVLPNVQERPTMPPRNLNTSMMSPSSSNLNQSVTSTTGTLRNPRTLNYLIKADLESRVEFAAWWTKYVVEPKAQYQQTLEEMKRTNKFDLNAVNCVLGLINCIRNNLVMPVVYPETDMGELTKTEEEKIAEPTPQDKEAEEKEKLMDKIEKLGTQFQPALNVHGEFFQAEHESVRSLSKVLFASKDSEKIRKTICLQTLWFLLNDSQKKISVICSELNKAYYEEFFSRQRKLYNSLNNVRFYADLHSCAVEGQHTIRKDGEIWFFDSGINGKLNEVIERVKDLNAYWIFTTEESLVTQYMPELTSMNVKYANLDADLSKKMAEMNMNEKDLQTMPWLTGTSLKFPLHLQCDLLIIGDIVGLTQLKSLYRYLKSSFVPNYASFYQTTAQQNNGNNYNSQYQPQPQQLGFNPTKKFRTVKFIRGVSIDNLRSSLKMHDSIQAQVALLHVGDDDLFKTRNPATTVERVKELATLVKEYCPKTFTVVSTLMRRMSRTENTNSSEVNKGIVQFCKQSKDSLNLYYMMNSHFEPDYHTQDGRVLNNKGLRMYVENLLSTVDYYLIKNHKQH